MPNNTGTRIKVDADLEARVLAGRTVLGPTASMREIAERVGVTERMARYVLTDLPRMRRLEDTEEKAQGSLKQRITWALQDVGDFRDVNELRTFLGRADSDHDVVHVLHSLHTQGLVDFTEGRDSKEPQRIHLTARGKGEGLTKAKPVTLDSAPVEERRTEHTVGDLVNGEAKPALPMDPDPEAVTLAPGTTLHHGLYLRGEKPEYPLLDALLDRERKRQEQDNAGMAYVTAAEAIEKIDPEAAKMLMAKAEALNVAFPSPIEAEYIQYVAAHP